MTEPAARIRPITAAAVAAVAAVIRAVMPEFGAGGPGFALHDPEVDAMSDAYRRPGHAYFVVVDEAGVVVGGGGVGALVGAPVDDCVCELRKMYLLPSARGRGQGEVLLRCCLDAARALGHRRCYLETLRSMTSAMRLYERLGFVPLPGPMGATGHFGCDRFYLLDL